MTAQVSELKARLRAGLEGVTPGPWKDDYLGFEPRDEATCVRIGALFPCINGLSAWMTFIELHMPDDAEEGMTDGARNRERVYRDATHIANCSPENIALLLDAFEEKCREGEEAKAALDKCERMHLPAATAAAIVGHHNCMQAVDASERLRWAAEAEIERLRASLHECADLLQEIAEPHRVDMNVSALNIWARSIEAAHRARLLLAKDQPK